MRLKDKLWQYEDILFLTFGIIWANLLFFHQENWTMNPCKVGIAGIGIYLCMKGLKKRTWKDTKMKIAGVIFGLLFSAMVVVGEKIHAGEWEFQAFSAADSLWLAVYFVTGVLSFLALSAFWEHREVQKFATSCIQGEQWTANRKKRWFLYSVFLAAFWLPVLLTYYPGIVPDDATISIAMVLGAVSYTHLGRVYGLGISNLLFSEYRYLYFYLYDTGMAAFVPPLLEKGSAVICSSSPFVGNLYRTGIWDFESGKGKPGRNAQCTHAANVPGLIRGGR